MGFVYVQVTDAPTDRMFDSRVEQRVALLAAVAGVLLAAAGCASLRPESRDGSGSADRAEPPEQLSESDMPREPGGSSGRGAEEAIYWAAQDIHSSVHLARSTGVGRAMRIREEEAAASETAGDSDTATDGGRLRSVDRSVDEEKGAPSEQWSETPTWPRLETTGEGDYGSVDPHPETTAFDGSDSDDRREVADRFGVELPDSPHARAFTGPFTDSATSTELAVVSPGRRLRIYRDGERILSTELPGDSDLPDPLREARPVRLVGDGTTQLLCYWSERADGGDLHYKVGVFKVIGHRVGRIFERTVGVRSSADAPLERRGFFDFLRGEDHRYIKWVPAGPDGRPRTDRSTVLHWNHWEGVFRPPTPPPTAPRPTS